MPNFLAPIQTNKIPVKGLVPESSGTAPTSPATGQMWTDTSLSPPVVKVWNGTAWIRTNGADMPDGTVTNAKVSASAAIALSKLAVNPADRANHIGSQTASTISDLATAVRTNRLDQMAVPTAAVDLGGQRAINAGDPTNAQDLVTKLHMENWIQNRINNQDWKASVRAATIANISLSGTQTVDGVALVAGDRVLVKAQTSGAQNGIYVVAVGSWGRAADASDSFEVTSGMTVPVEAGSTLAGTIWLLTTANPLVLDTTVLAFSQIGAAGATYTAGAGLDLTGNEFSLDIPVGVSHGGTGATTLSGARSALGISQLYAANLPALTAGVAATVTHNLGTLDVRVTFWDVATGADVVLDVVARPTVNTIQVRSDVPLAADAVRIQVVG
jgi:hypothetical protein